MAPLTTARRCCYVPSPVLLVALLTCLLVLTKMNPCEARSAVIQDSKGTRSLLLPAGTVDYMQIKIGFANNQFEYEVSEDGGQYDICVAKGQYLLGFPSHCTSTSRSDELKVEYEEDEYVTIYLRCANVSGLASPIANDSNSIGNGLVADASCSFTVSWKLSERVGVMTTVIVVVLFTLFVVVMIGIGIAYVLHVRAQREAPARNSVSPIIGQSGQPGVDSTGPLVQVNLGTIQVHLGGQGSPTDSVQSLSLADAAGSPSGSSSRQATMQLYALPPHRSPSPPTNALPAKPSPLVTVANQGSPPISPANRTPPANQNPPSNQIPPVHPNPPANETQAASQPSPRQDSSANQISSPTPANQASPPSLANQSPVQCPRSAEAPSPQAVVATGNTNASSVRN